MNWQASATYVTSFVKAAEELGHLNAVLPRLDAPTAEMVKRPGAQAWWPGAQLIALLTAIETSSGRDALKAIDHRASHGRMLRLIQPLASVVLSLAKEPMIALLARLKNFVAAGVKGVDADFMPHVGKAGGVVTFSFPEPVPEVMSVLWRGMFDVGFTMARGGSIVSEQIEPRVHRYEVTW